MLPLYEYILENKFESSIIEQLEEYINIPKESKKERDDFKGNHQNLLNLLNSGVLDNYAIEIKHVGKQRVVRNNEHQIINKEFTINKGKFVETLKESGKKIADIVIESPKGNVYISCKELKSQLSGVSIKPIMGNKSVFSLNVKEKNKYNANKLVHFNNFWKCVGVDPESLYNFYKDRSEDIKLLREYDKSALGIFFQKIIGGNYWYCNPNFTMWLGPNIKECKYKVESVTVSKPGKTININGKLDDIKCKLVVRTDGRGDFPYRCFPVIDMEKYINAVS